MNQVLESLPDLAFYELTVAGAVKGWSEGARKLLGFTPEEVIGHHVEDLAKKAVTIAPLTALEEAVAKGRSETFGPVIRKDGTRFWANEVTVPIRDDSGNATGFARVVRDVSSWKELEADRDRIFTLSNDLICVAGFDGYFKRVNPAWSKVLGYTEAELLSTPYINFVHPDDVDATRAEAAENASGSGESVAVSFQNRYRCADGSYRWLDWKSSPVVADKLIYCVARDVTGQKEIEQKFVENAKELRRSNEALQQFAYVASHDLQEPLRAVVGCVQLLAERNAGKLDERSTVLMGFAVDGAKRMQTLISDLLAYSRVGSKGITKALTDAGQAVTKALLQLQTAIVESDAVISVDPLPHIWADKRQLVQLFQNLIGNSIKFRAETRPEIHVRAEQHVKEMIFTVSDNGIGIAPEHHERMFGVFQRLHAQRKYAGTGIGLAICKKIVEGHGGRLWVESEAGAGAKFCFSLPNSQTE